MFTTYLNALLSVQKSQKNMELSLFDEQTILLQIATSTLLMDHSSDLHPINGKSTVAI